jgi:hypothetical protein
MCRAFASPALSISQFWSGRRGHIRTPVHHGLNSAVVIGAMSCSASRKAETQVSWGLARQTRDSAVPGSTRACAASNPRHDEVPSPHPNVRRFARQVCADFWCLHISSGSVVPCSAAVGRSSDEKPWRHLRHSVLVYHPYTAQYVGKLKSSPLAPEPANLNPCATSGCRTPTRSNPNIAKHPDAGMALSAACKHALVSFRKTPIDARSSTNYRLEPKTGRKRQSMCRTLCPLTWYGQVHSSRKIPRAKSRFDT